VPVPVDGLPLFGAPPDSKPPPLGLVCAKTPFVKKRTVRIEISLLLFIEPPSDSLSVIKPL